MVAWAAAGCAASTGGRDDGWREKLLEQAREPGVMAQFCVLETKGYQYLSASSILRRGDAPRSANSAMTRYLGTSETGQHVFQGFLGGLDEFSAVMVFPVGAVQQVFLENKALYSAANWSEWVAPDAVSADQKVRSNLIQGLDVARVYQGAIRTYARFKVGTYLQWREETDGYDGTDRRTDLESCPLAPVTGARQR